MRFARLFGLLSLALCLAMVARSARADEPLRLVTLEWPPYEFKADGKVKGVAVDIVREAFSRLDTDITIQLNPWARSLEMVRRGDADAIFTAYRTDKRETFLTYCDEVLAMQRVGLFKRTGGDIDFNGDMATLSDKRVAVVRDVSYGKKFDRMVERDGFKKVRVVNGAHPAVRLLVRGDVDLIPGNVAAVRTALAETGYKDEVQLVRPVLSQVPSYIAFSKKAGEGDRCDQVNATLRAMREDGTVREIYEAYNAR